MIRYGYLRHGETVVLALDEATARAAGDGGKRVPVAVVPLKAWSGRPDAARADVGDADVVQIATAAKCYLDAALVAAGSRARVEHFRQVAEAHARRNDGPSDAEVARQYMSEAEASEADPLAAYYGPKRHPGTELLRWPWPAELWRGDRDPAVNLRHAADLVEAAIAAYESAKSTEGGRP